MSKPGLYKAMARTIAKDLCLGISGGRRIGPSPTHANQPHDHTHRAYKRSLEHERHMQ